MLDNFGYTIISITLPAILEYLIWPYTWQNKSFPSVCISMPNDNVNKDKIVLWLAGSLHISSVLHLHRYILDGLDK